MNQEVIETGFVSATILKLYEEVSKVTGANNPPDLSSIGVAVVLARAGINRHANPSGKGDSIIAPRRQSGATRRPRGDLGHDCPRRIV